MLIHIWLMALICLVDYIHIVTVSMVSFNVTKSVINLGYIQAQSLKWVHGISKKTLRKVLIFVLHCDCGSVGPLMLNWQLSMSHNQRHHKIVSRGLMGADSTEMCFQHLWIHVDSCTKPFKGSWRHYFPNKFPPCWWNYLYNTNSQQTDKNIPLRLID